MKKRYARRMKTKAILIERSGFMVLFWDSDELAWNIAYYARQFEYWWFGLNVTWFVAVGTKSLNVL